MKKLAVLFSVFAVAMGAAFQVFCADTIHLAAYHGNEAKVIELLKTNPDPDVRDSYGGTALHAAMFQDNTRIVELLMMLDLTSMQSVQETAIPLCTMRCGEQPASIENLSGEWR